MSRGRPRIVLIGATYRALCAMEHLIDRGERIVAFIGHEGDGERDFCQEILDFCERSSIPARSARKLGEEIVRWLEDRIRPDLAIAIGMDGPIPLAIGGNCRLGLLEVIDQLQSESCPGIVLRQRGQEISRRELPSFEGDRDEADLYSAVVDESLKALDRYLDGLVPPSERGEVSVSFGKRGVLDTLGKRVSDPQPGPETDALEQDLCDFVDADHVIALSSVDNAFGAVIRALDIQPRDEIICSAMVSASAVSAIQAAGARAVFADVEPGRLTLDPGAIQPLVSSRTRALLITHAFGQPAPMDRL